MNLDFAFICDFAEATGKINALGIGFDTIYAKQVPFRHPHFCVVAQLRASVAEAGEKSVEVYLIDADGNNVIPPIRQKFPMPRAEGRIHSIGRMVIEFGNVEFKDFGSYSVRIVIEGVEVVVVSFTISLPPSGSR